MPPGFAGTNVHLLGAAAGAGEGSCAVSLSNFKTGIGTTAINDEDLDEPRRNPLGDDFQTSREGGLLV
ncbi:MAG: hypothetical protein AAFZ52_05785 [Bacteroidota bacterium]